MLTLNLLIFFSLLSVQLQLWNLSQAIPFMLQTQFRTALRVNGHSLTKDTKLQTLSRVIFSLAVSPCAVIQMWIAQSLYWHNPHSTAFANGLSVVSPSLFLKKWTIEVVNYCSIRSQLCSVPDKCFQLFNYGGIYSWEVGENSS